MIIFRKVKESKIAILANSGQLRAIYCLKNCSKLVEGSSCAIIDLLLADKFIFLFFEWRVVDDFHKNPQTKKKFVFFLLLPSTFHNINAP